MKNLLKTLLIALPFVFAAGTSNADSGSKTTPCYIVGKTVNIASGCTFHIFSGGTFQIDSGAASTFPAGGGTATLKPAGFISAQTPTTANGNGADTTEDTLVTYSLPANTFNAAGQTLRIKAWGTTGANGDNKVIKLYFGASVIPSGTVTTNNGVWQASCDVVRGATASTQAVICTGASGATGFTPYSNAGTDSETAAVTIKATGQDTTGSTANSVVAKGMTVEMLN
jgi:hypothetical protein